MRVLGETTDALVLGVTQERAQCVRTHIALTAVIGSHRTLIDVWKKDQININSIRHLDKQKWSLFAVVKDSNLLSTPSASVWALNVLTVQQVALWLKHRISIWNIPEIQSFTIPMFNWRNNSNKRITWSSGSAINRSWAKLPKWQLLDLVSDG